MSVAASPQVYRCGTLVYTKAALFTLFGWLLWGDFCFSLMETIWPNVLPLMLRAEGTPNFLLSLVITTIPSVMNFVLNPIISTASDRHRGRLGRRIPFLLGATPFVTLCLVLLGFSRELGRLAHGALIHYFPDLSAASVTIAMICLLIVCFRFFELFVNTVFWYLFNDVVPAEFMGRFLGFFKVVGSLAGALFHFFLFTYAESHTSVLFFSVAILYGTAFMFMAANVKEGKYPPPESVRGNPFAWIRTFFKDCLGHRIFRRVFTYSAFLGFCNAINAFAVFMAVSIGLTLDEIGKVAGAAAVVGMLLMYPMGYLVDRFHPLRVMVAAKTGYCLVVAVKFVFLFHEFSRPVAFWIYASAAAIAIPINVANTAASFPMIMRLFPHEKFGQFCSANAMCTSLGTILGGVFAGIFLDTLKRVFPGSDYYYRFVPVWNVFFMLLALGAMVLVYREWKRLGGDRNYLPPVTDRFKTTAVE
jgi:maltose/moltooligosaccharide transporter